VVDNIKNILSKFTPTTLGEMDTIKLMDRRDTKYIFTLAELPRFLHQLTDDYRVLDVEGNRISRYESLYFDTPDFEFYHKHQRGKANRYKLRYRKYVESDLVFFELKYKSNKGRTIKNRIRQEGIDDTISAKASEWLHSKKHIAPRDVEPKFKIFYSRITLVNKNFPERVTLDIDLWYRNHSQSKSFDNLVIAEVKQDKSAFSAFKKLMKKYHVRTASLSKYCLGVINLTEDIKYNNFKPVLINLKKILDGPSASA